jgi:hypothetical protein
VAEAWPLGKPAAAPGMVAAWTDFRAASRLHLGNFTRESAMRRTVLMLAILLLCCGMAPNPDWSNINIKDLRDLEYRDQQDLDIAYRLDLDRDGVTDLVKMMKNVRKQQFGIFFCKGNRSTFNCAAEPFFTGSIETMANFYIEGSGRPGECPVAEKHCFDGGTIESSAAVFWWDRGVKHRWYAD